jgi:hypothetical protein
MNRSSALQKIGWFVLAIGVIYMLGSGWLYSWWMVPEIERSGAAAMTNLRGMLWGLSVPIGVFIVAIGAALIGKVERRAFWLLVLVTILFVLWRVVGTTSRFVPALFGIGGGLITLFFLGSVLHWARVRPRISQPAKTGTDLSMLGLVFFVVVAWDLCGIFGVGNFVLRPELAGKFAVPLTSTINAATGVLILLVLGWGFTYLGQLKSRQAQTGEV